MSVITEKQREEILALRSTGLSYVKVAKQIGIRYGIVRYTIDRAKYLAYSKTRNKTEESRTHNNAYSKKYWWKNRKRLSKAKRDRRKKKKIERLFIRAKEMGLI